MSPSRKIDDIPVDSIRPDPDQARSNVDEDTIEGIAKTFEDGRLISPITVRELDEPDDEGHEYEIVTGEQRWRAAKRVGWDEIESIIDNVSEEQKQDEQLIENIHRSDLSAVEKGDAMVRRFKEAGIEFDSMGELASLSSSVARHKQRDKLRNPSAKGDKYDKLREMDSVMSQLGVNGDAVAIWIRNAAASEYVRAHQEAGGGVSSRTIERLSKVEDKDLQNRLYDKIAEDDLARRSALELIRSVEGEEVVGEEMQEYLLSDKSNIYNEKVIAPIRAMGIDEEKLRLHAWMLAEEEHISPDEVDDLVDLVEHIDEQDTVSTPSVEELAEKFEAYQNSEFDIEDDVEEMEIGVEQESDDVGEEETVTMEVPRSTAESIQQTARNIGTSEEEVVETSVKAMESAPVQGYEDGQTVAVEDTAIDDWEWNEDHDLFVPKDSEEKEEFIERVETQDKKHKAIAEDEDTQEMGRLRENWEAYTQAMPTLQNATCPHPNCDNGIEHLTWDCHGYTVEEAFRMSHQNYQDAVYEAPPLEEVYRKSDYDFDEEVLRNAGITSEATENDANQTNGTQNIDNEKSTTNERNAVDSRN